jgi:hypothetical protein
VISVIAVLLAILVPVMHRVRELGQRTVCLSNLRQLTLGWNLYAEDNEGRLINGVAFSDFTSGGHDEGSSRILRSWIDPALSTICIYGDPNFTFDEFSRFFHKFPNKGALWPYINDYDTYLCSRGQMRNSPAYSIVGSANGLGTVPGTIRGHKYSNRWLVAPGKRIGKTVLVLNNLQDIISPGPSQRAVFIDTGLTERSFDVGYNIPLWYKSKSAPPTHHAKGVTLSMADGHAEYWKWRGSETLDIATQEVSNANGTPQTDDGLFDLQRMQKVIWGRLGYSFDKN